MVKDSSYANVFRILIAVDKFARETDPEFNSMAWRRALREALQRLCPVALFSLMLKWLVEAIIRDPAYFALVLGVTLFSSMLMRLATQAFDDYFSWKQDEFLKKMRDRVEELLLDKSLSLDLGALQDSKVISLVRRAGSTGKDSLYRLWDIERYALVNILACFFSFGVLLYADPLLTIMAVIPSVACEWYRAKIVDHAREKVQQKTADDETLKSEYGWCLSDRNMSFQLRLFRVIPHFRARYVELRDSLFESEREFEKFEYAISWLFIGASFIASMMALCYLVFRIHIGGMPPERMMFCFGELSVFAGAFRSLTSNYKQILRFAGHYQDFEQYLALSKSIDETHAEAMQLSAAPRIVFDNVTFIYPGSEKPALRECTLAFEPGEVVALVGPNGSGKTTIASLLAKFFVPKEGHISIDGVPLSRITQESWLAHLLYVTWGNVVPDFPIDEVVASMKREDVDFDRLLRAAKMTGVHEFVKDLPSRYGTPIGSTLPGGRNFSSGQLQRIKLSAGIYQALGPGRHLFFCDEPMANCDHAIREKFYGSLRAEFGGKRTVIVIAHDPMYLHHFDRVVVLEKGQVANDLRDKVAIENYKSVLSKQLTEGI